VLEHCCLAHLLVSWSICLSLSVGQSIRWVNCGKTADWILMPFEVVSGSVEDGCIRWGWRSSKGRAVLGVNVGHPVVTSGEFVVKLFSAVRVTTCSSQITLGFPISIYNTAWRHLIHFSPEKTR